MYVYLLKLPGNKVYIGSTSNLEKRLREHKSYAKTKPDHQPISKAINECGWNKVICEVALICETKEQSLAEENRLINEYKDKWNLVNKLDRPESWHKSHSLAAKKRMTPELVSKRSKKMWRNPVFRERLVIAARRRALSNPSEMRKRQKLSRDSFIESRPLVKLFKNNILILETKETVKLAEAMGIKQTSICRYIRGERKPREKTGFRLEIVCQ